MSLELIEKKVKVPKETDDVGQYLKAVIVEYRRAKADGSFEPGKEVPQIMMSTIQQLLQAFNGIQDVMSLAKSKPVGTLLALAIPIKEAIEADEDKVMKLSDSIRKELGYVEDEQDDEEEDEDAGEEEEEKKKKSK